MSADRSTRVTNPWPSLRLVGGHLTALTALALVHPLLQLIGQSPEFFVAHGVNGWELLLILLLLITVIPCLALLIAAGLRAISLPAHKLFVSLCVAAAIGALALQALKGVSPLGGGTLVLATGAVVAMIAGGSYLRFPGFRSFVTALTPAIVVIPALFLFNPNVSQFLWREPDPLPTYHVDTKTPIVLVVFDSFPLASLLNGDLEIDPVLYPAFAGLARDGIWFRNATTVATHTRWAVSGIVSGKYPQAAAIPDTSWYPDNLFTVFGASHQLNVLEPMTSLCPSTLCKREEKSEATRFSSLARDLAIVYAHVVMPDRWAEDLPPLDEGWANFGGGGGKAMSARAGWLDIPEIDDRRRGPEAFIRSMSVSGDQPPLWFMHVVLPHNPFLYEPNGHSYGGQRGTPKELKEGFWIEDPVRVAQIYQRHLLQVGYVDSLLGQLTARLKELGVYEETLVAVLADHGESFRPGDRRRSITPTNQGEVMAIPFIIKPPGVNLGRVIDDPVESVDFMPTVADLLDVELPYSTDGQSALKPQRARTTRRILALPYQAKSMSDPEEYRVEDVPWDFQWVADAAKRKLELFEGGNPWKLRVNAQAVPLGTDIEAIDISAAPDITVQVNGLRRFENVSTGNEQLPLRVNGTIEAATSSRSPLGLSIAVNGKIWANTVVLSDGSWWALVPPAALRDGSNEVAVFVSSAGDRPALARPTVKGAD